MDTRTWDTLVKTIKDGHVALAAEGMTAPPHLWALKDGRLVARIHVRPITVGQDALSAIAEMATLPAGARADEIVCAWETHDIAAACALVPLGPWPCLNIVRADPGGHELHQFPYTEGRLGVGPNGLQRIAPLWGLPRPAVSGAEVPPSIQALLQYSWQPFEGLADQSAEAAAYLKSEGYSVSLLA